MERRDRAGDLRQGEQPARTRMSNNMTMVMTIVT